MAARPYRGRFFVPGTRKISDVKFGRKSLENPAATGYI